MTKLPIYISLGMPRYMQLSMPQLSLAIALVLGFASDRSMAVSFANVPFSAPQMDSISSLDDSDPFWGRFACPSLSRLRLQKETNEPFVLADLSQELPPAGTKSQTKWRLTMRPGVSWWNGAEFTATDLTQYLTKELRTDISRFFSGLVEFSEFQVAAPDDSTVVITWNTPPPFGPYVLNAVRPWRVAEAPTTKSSEGSAATDPSVKFTAFECVGRYRIVELAGKAALSPVRTAPTGTAGINIVATTATTIDNAITFARPITPSLSEFSKSNPNSCGTPVELPFYTVIAWNHASPLSGVTEFRKAMTQLIPRGEIVRAGTGYLGTLVSSPMSRSHPGYNAQNIVRTYSPKDAAKTMERLGYRRAGSQLRMDKAGNPLRITIASAPASPGRELLEKLIADSLALAGISVRFVTESAEVATADGMMTTIRTSWPAANLLAVFFDNDVLWGKKDFLPMSAALRSSLRAYALGLTYPEPQLAKLREVHNAIYDLEPMSVVMQHNTCVTVPRGVVATKIDARDPDWLWNLTR